MTKKKPALYQRMGNEPVCELKKTAAPKVYITNGLRVKECITTQQKALVYIWAPKCKGKLCYPLELLQQKCISKKIDLYVVAEYYDNDLMDFDYKTRHPLLAIDPRYYHTNRTQKYLRRFVLDLTQQPDISHRCFYFESGKFIGHYDTVDDIKS